MTDDPRIILLEQLNAFRLTDLYKALIVPIQEDIDSLKSSYDCKTLTDLATLKGTKKGLDKVFSIMARIETEAETARDEIRRADELAIRNKPPEDSSDL